MVIGWIRIWVCDVSQRTWVRRLSVCSRRGWRWAPGQTSPPQSSRWGCCGRHSDAKALGSLPPQSARRRERGTYKHSWSVLKPQPSQGSCQKAQLETSNFYWQTEVMELSISDFLSEKLIKVLSWVRELDRQAHSERKSTVCIVNICYKFLHTRYLNECKQFLSATDQCSLLLFLLLHDRSKGYRGGRRGAARHSQHPGAGQ